MSLWYFEDTDLYKMFCPHNVKAAERKHVFEAFKKDDFIYFSDEKSSHIYLVQSGQVKIGLYTSAGKEVVKAILQKGEIFGEQALTGEDRRQHFAQVISADVSVCPLRLADMQDLMKQDKEFSFKIFRMLGLRLIKAERKIESLMNKDAKTRIVEYLVDLADERGQRVGQEVLVKHFFKHKDIASLTATSRQTVTTVLNELRENNVIHFDRKRLLIRDIEQLRICM
jgi:CRP/FNR family cyclic AMP-dependent transcriptional regulator